MAVYYKFKSAKDYDSIPIDGHFISVFSLKERVFESKHLGKGTDFDLLVTNAQTNEEYLDEAMLIPKNTSVLIRRVPGRPRMTIVTEPVFRQEGQRLETDKSDEPLPAKSSILEVDSSVHEDTEWDEFGSDLYAIPEVLPFQASTPIQLVPAPSKDDEDSKINALIHTPALDWQSQTSDGFGLGRGFGRGMGGRMTGGRGFGRGGLEWKTPPPGYVCHRCKVPGHFIQHCPTNGDHDYDIKRVKPPTGIPRSMLVTTSDGSYALPSGAVAVLRPNEAAFEKEMEGLPSTRSVGDLPPELHCPLCKEVMKDAVLTSKCCFNSYCDKCIRDHIISKSVCVCGATNVLADDLLPNKTLRDTINRILESNNSSAENAGSASEVQDMESRIPHRKFPSPTSSAASKGEQVPPPQSEEISKVKETGDQRNVFNAPQNTSKEGTTIKVSCVSQATHESISVKEPASQGSVPTANEVVQQKPVSGEAGMRKKKKKDRLPLNAAEIPWKNSQDLAFENYRMSLGPSSYNPYWTGMQAGMDGYGSPYGGPLPYMGYGHRPLDFPFGVLPQDPHWGQGYMMPPVPPQMNLANCGMRLNAGPPIMSREEFEAKKADVRRKRETERLGERRELSRDREFSREAGSNGDVSSLKSRNNSHSQQPLPADNHRSSHNHQHRRPPQPEMSPVDRRADDPKLHPAQSSTKRRSASNEDYKMSSSPPRKPMSAASSRKGVSAADCESSDDDDRHFKRKRPRSRDDRERNRGSCKHR